MGNTVKMRLAKESFLLLRPDPKRNSHEIAKEIASCDCVKKVFITSGEYGFVISALTDDNGVSKALSKVLKRNGGRMKTKAIKGHFVYSCSK